MGEQVWELVEDNERRRRLGRQLAESPDRSVPVPEREAPTGYLKVLAKR